MTIRAGQQGFPLFLATNNPWTNSTGSNRRGKIHLGRRRRRSGDAHGRPCDSSNRDPFDVTPEKLAPHNPREEIRRSLSSDARNKLPSSSAAFSNGRADGDARRGENGIFESVPARLILHVINPWRRRSPSKGRKVMEPLKN